MCIYMSAYVCVCKNLQVISDSPYHPQTQTLSHERESGSPCTELLPLYICPV